MSQEKYKVTKKIEFDYGHRVPFHQSKCFNTHGHRGVVEVTLEGKLVDIHGDNDFGMVMDFSRIKEAMLICIHDVYDHKFLLWKDDPLFEKYKDLPGVVVIDFVPTAENLARKCFWSLRMHLKKLKFEATVTSVRFYETPSSFSEYSMEQ